MPSNNPRIAQLPYDGSAPTYLFRVVLAWRLRTARRAIRLTQQGLASRLGVSRALVGAWEQGATLPPVHRIADLAATLTVQVQSLVIPPGGDNQVGGSSPAMERALSDAARAELVHAAQARREPVAPTVIIHALGGRDARPTRGRPGGLLAVAADQSSPGPPVLVPAVQTAKTVTEPMAPAEAARAAGPDIRNRVKAALLAGGLREHGWAHRDLARYWRLLEAMRASLTARAPLDPREARALAPVLDTLHTADVLSATDAATRLRAWATGATPASAYFARIASLGDAFALACVDAVAQARVSAASTDVRVGLLLALLGEDVDWA